MRGHHRAVSCVKNYTPRVIVSIQISLSTRRDIYANIHTTEFLLLHNQQKYVYPGTHVWHLRLFSRSFFETSI